MNKESRKFLIWGIVLSLVPVMMGVLLIGNNVKNELSSVPFDVEKFALAYIQNESLNFNSNQPQIYSYKNYRSNGALIHKLSFIDDGKSKGEVALEIIEIENSDSQNIIRSYNQFKFVNSYILKYSFLIVAVALYFISVYTASICYGSTKKDKWKRSLFILCGVGTVSMNWATSVLEVNFINTAIPTVGVNYGGTYPTYTVLLHIPIGLIIYWIKWRKEDEERVSEVDINVNNYV